MNGHVVLIGLSGSGKSTVGHYLAERLDCRLYDTDMLLALRSRLSAPELLRADAVRFRATEEEVVDDACSRPPGVIATGGGAILSARNRKTLRRGNLVVWLRAPVAVLAARLAAGESRPLLDGDVTARLAALAAERDALYAACAHEAVETDGTPPDAIAWRIAALVAERDASDD